MSATSRGAQALSRGERKTERFPLALQEILERFEPPWR
jgi:hypothetical protein